MCGFLHNAFRGVCTFYRYRVLARQGQIRATLLGTGCKEHAYAEKTAAATLADVRKSMRIDYFDNDNLLK